VSRSLLSRSLAAAVALAAGAVCFALVAPRAHAFTISGRVVKGADHAPTQGITVTLHVVRGNEEIPGKTVTTGPSGAFRFANLQESPGLEYYVSTEYEGAVYTEGPIAAAGKPEVSQDLPIFDVGREFDAVHVQNHHVIVERKEDGLHVTEILVFQNGAATAFLGVGVNHAQPSGARVGLPASVKGFKPGIGGDEQTVQVKGRELTSLRPIPPGQRPFSFTYHVPLSGRMDLSHRLYFPTHQFVVLVDDPKLRIESPLLKSAGTREQGGRTFTLYSGTEIPVGSEVQVRVAGAGFFSNPALYPWLAAPVLIAAVLIMASRRGRKAKVPRQARLEPLRNGGDDLAQVYLYLIAALDQGMERGEYSEECHALVRGNLKRRLESILSDEPRTGTR
jgi:hypothetical protein